ncbi:akt protein [Thecamonas trahens ATCC 50062]|uniref:non-specific serine/threonine protein kinase n=1 Tax=Thecamonas trahens ATCC 50062 TaxID=461836 RepID=A0A0L0DL59_THETB|nr:akt protein [Thecamonas trahens ATCC 50062]KNC52113.1 akt protein [Thecamonas trahens ATCC 50062]|eukprot:XP_013762117.1 akt protein [Thecamonas trahens ATCC 50062]
MSAGQVVRIHFPDGSFRSVPLTPETDVTAVTKMIFDKNKLCGSYDEYALYEQAGSGSPLRKLGIDEKPLVVQKGWPADLAAECKLVLRPVNIKAPPLKEGYLVKRGHFVKNYKRRFYRMANGLALYFRSHKDTTPAGCIPLKGATVQVAPAKIKKKFSFQITTRDGTEHFCIAGSEQEMNSWMEAVQEWINYYYLQAYTVTEAEDGTAVPAASSKGSGAAVAASEADAADDSAASKVTIKDFELLQLLGKGSFGKVMLARKRGEEQLYAIKILKKDVVLEHEEVEHTQAERRVLSTMDHPFLVRMYYSFQTDDRLYFVMDYVRGGELFYHMQRSGKFSEERAKFYAAEIVCALGYLHRKGIVYRDLKLENLLLDEDGHILITDFGLVKEGISYGVTTSTFCGTPEYLAPEVVEDASYGTSVDWWSAGVVIYEMLSGRSPFSASDPEQVFIQILEADIYYPRSLSEQARDLLEHLLDRNPKTRLGSGPGDAEEIKAHPFFDDIDFDALEAKQLTPPFKPELTSDTDTSHFDPCFTQEPAMLTPAQPSAISSAEQSNFAGFTFVSDTPLGNGA